MPTESPPAAADADGGALRAFAEGDLIGSSLGRRIRTARTEKKLSMRALARAAEMSQAFLSQIEAGRSMPSILTLFRLAHALEVSPSELLPAAVEPDPITVTRRDEGETVPVSEADDGAFSRIIASEATQGASIQEYRIGSVPYRGEWFVSDGQNTVYVVEGSVTVTMEDHGEWTLDAGDSLTHPGSFRNRWSVNSGEGVVLILVHVA